MILKSEKKNDSITRTLPDCCHLAATSNGIPLPAGTANANLSLNLERWGLGERRGGGGFGSSFEPAFC